MRIGVIGLGNMGSAIVDGLLKKNMVTPKNVFATSKHYDKLIKKCGDRDINACIDPLQVVSNSDLVIIATPTSLFNKVILKIKDVIENKIVVSVCSGITYDKDVKNIAPNMHFIETIPSTPIRYGEGIMVCENNHSLDEKDLLKFNNLFMHVSLIQFVDTSKLDIASTISGCGPAFAAMFVEALGDAGCKYGLTREEGYTLASKMLVGLGTSYLVSKKHPGQLKDEVCSPNGSTIKGVSTLEEHGFRNAIIKAIDEICK